MSRIENKVMASVLLIHTARRALSFTAFKAYVAGVSLGTIAYLVSLPNVLRNLSHVGVDGFATFFSAAVVQTEITVQLALALALVFGVLFTRDLVRDSSRSLLA
ncbi:MAG TPA: hypothetical protein VJG29_02105 [Candidatus Paceibacterota bacterium]